MRLFTKNNLSLSFSSNISCSSDHWLLPKLQQRHFSVFHDKYVENQQLLRRAEKLQKFYHTSGPMFAEQEVQLEGIPESLDSQSLHRQSFRFPTAQWPRNRNGWQVVTQVLGRPFHFTAWSNRSLSKLWRTRNFELCYSACHNLFKSQHPVDSHPYLLDDWHLARGCWNSCDVSEWRNSFDRMSAQKKMLKIWIQTRHKV